jgi:CO dehydrogenase/acetyl-CoA synthase beta subunit
VNYDPERKPFVILQEDTHTELGNPVAGSASMVLWSRQTELIRDGMLTRIGPDIPEAEGESLPFGQVILLGGSGLADKQAASLERASDLGHALEGYMIRRVPRKLWSRVSRAAVEQGFSLESLGRVLMARYRERFPEVQTVEVLFVTASKAHVEELEAISLQAKGKSLSLRKLSRAGDGAYECEELNCDTCPEKPTCDTIREVLVIRKKGKITGVQIVREPIG